MIIKAIGIHPEMTDENATCMIVGEKQRRSGILSGSMVYNF